jgi:hypothetical protein
MSVMLLNRNGANYNKNGINQARKESADKIMAQVVANEKPLR